MTRSLTALMATCLSVFLCAPARAQTQPLPDHLRSDFAPFGANHSGIRFVLSSDPDEALRLNAIVQFDTSEQTVSLWWSFYPPGGPFGSKTLTYDAGFEPTAICRKNGYGPSLFVAGYREQGATVVIEQWTFEDVRMGVTTPADRSHPIPALSMTLRKDTLVRTNALAPVFGMAYHPTTDDLWIFTDPSPRAVFKLDLTAPDARPVRQFDAVSAGWQALERAGRITAGWIEPEAPDGGGFIILGLGARNWNRLPPPTHGSVFMMRDIGCDGTFDELTEGTCADTLTARSYHAFERKRYP